MQNGTEIALARPVAGRPKATRKRDGRRRHIATRPQLLDRSQLDGRTNAAKIYDRLVANIQNDLGGREALSTVKAALVEAFAGAYVTVNNLNTRMLLGQAIDLGQHAQAVSAMVRVASRLGIERVARNITPSVRDYIASINEAAE
jgi:hypothetical protein